MPGVVGAGARCRPRGGARRGARRRRGSGRRRCRSRRGGGASSARICSYGVVLGVDAVGQVGPVEAGRRRCAGSRRRREVDDVGAHALGRGRGERHDRARRGSASRSSARRRYSGRKSWPHSLMQWASSTAMRAHVPAAQRRRGSRHHEPLRRDVEQPVAPLARGRRAARRTSSASSEELRKVAGTPAACERVDLILHQGDERRDDDREAGAHHGGELEAEALAAAGGQQREDVAAREGVADDLLLERAERGSRSSA